MKIHVTQVFVDDQDKALEFYTKILGFEPREDVPPGEYRWLTVTGTGEPESKPVEATARETMPALAFHEALTERELEILRLIDIGLSNREIAEALYISLNTVKTHTKSLYSKLNVHSRTQAINRARDLKLL